MEKILLFLKSDCILSKYYFQDIYDLPKNISVYFTTAFINTKKRVTNDEIIEYSHRDSFIESDDITFFIEDRFKSTNNDFIRRPNITPIDPQIKFISCYGIKDWSCHLISIDLLEKVEIKLQNWGGVNLQKLEPFFIETYRSFVIHKYHSIVSINRNKPRDGGSEDWYLS